MEVKLPNFLIVGAAKSGTTSLYHYLKQHPQIYMSPVKEPKFITAQFIQYPPNLIRNKKVIKNFDDYKKLFKKARDEKAIGEASVDYLFFYEGAIKYIKRYLGDVKIIIIIRNPAERIFAFHKMLVRHLKENLSFEDALKTEKDTSSLFGPGRQYKKGGLCYDAVKAYLENFKNVRIYLYDDLQTNALNLIKDIYAFLNVDISFTPDMSIRYNIGGVPKNRFAAAVLFRFGQLQWLRNLISSNLFLGKIAYRVLNHIKSRNFKMENMKPETRKYLNEFYKEDIIKLQELIKRDLTHWLK